MSEHSKKICDPKNFKKIYETYAKELRSYLYFKFGDKDNAEDIMQDAFVKLWKNCATVPYDKAQFFLFRVANNLFLNVKKHEKIVRKNQVHLVKETDIETPDYLLEEKEFQVKLEKIINSLTPKQKEVFMLSRVEKLKYKEIAIQLDISVKAVEKRMHKALLIMREKIGKI